MLVSQPLGTGRVSINLTDVFQCGLVEHRAGRLQRAEAAYRQILAVEPSHADALHLLGVIAYQTGHNEVAIKYIRRAITLHVSGTPEIYNNLGVILLDLGRTTEAEASCREALRLRPDFAGAHNNLGNALRDRGRMEEAEASYREALRLQPDYPEAHNNLGNALRDFGRLAEAEASCREALRLRPDYPEAYNNFGAVLHALGRLAEAEVSYRKAFRLRWDYPEAHNNLGNTLRDLGRLAEAEASYREALRLRPDYPQTHLNLGNTLRDRGCLTDAEACYREALRLRPAYTEAHNNLGVVLRELGRLVEAEASCRKALRLRPDDAEAHHNLSNVLLSAGRFDEGWEEYEWRWRTKHQSSHVRDFAAPLWCGEAIRDRVILLHAEQGFGDTLQFCRYVPSIAAGAKVVLEVQTPLVRLLSGLPGILAIAARGDRLPSFDLHCPLLSLPRLVGTTLDTIPADTPYLAADPTLVARWRERLIDLDGLRVGLVWAGGRRPPPPLDATDSRRSISLDAMAPFAEVSGVSFISLQKGEPAVQSSNPPRDMTLYDYTADLCDFADTAALIESLDLVISVDTAVVHLAGALGKPIWLLNRFDTDWRWLFHRNDSPWYTTLRQFRQPAPGDWENVIREVREALERLAAGDRDQLRPRRAGD